MADNTPIAAGAMPAGEYAIVEALGHRTLVGSLKSAPSVWPLQRADGTRWNEAPKPGYNPLGKARDAN